MGQDMSPAETLFYKYELHSIFGGAQRDELLASLYELAGEEAPTPVEPPPAPPVTLEDQVPEPPPPNPEGSLGSGLEPSPGGPGASGGGAVSEANGSTWGNRNA